MRIVLDTNVLMAAFVADGLCRDLVKSRVLTHELVVSEILLDELTEKLRDKFNAASGDVPMLAAYRDRAELVTAQPLPSPICRDPDDDWVLATAVSGAADVIVTGDEDLLSLVAHEGIRILSPRRFLEFLDHAE